MLTGLIQVGQYLLDKRGKTSEPYIEVIENPNDNGRYKHILKIVFYIFNIKLCYKEIAYEQFSESRIHRYAYKKGSARGGDCTPTSKYTDPEKTLNKLVLSLKNLLDSVSNEHNEYPLFSEICRIMEQEYKTIRDDIEAKLKAISIPKKEAAVITLTIYTDSEEKYMGDFDIIKERLNTVSEEQYYNKYGKISKGIGECFYCKNKKEVFGFVNTYNFYTLDKIGFVSGGLDQEKAWRNYPVCSSCAHTLEYGRRYISKNLTSRFSGFDYSVIPKLSINNKLVMDEVFDILEDFEREKFSSSERVKDNLLNSEENFLEIMSENRNFLNYNLLIFREEQSGSVFRILLYIEDIVPSKLKSILRIKEKVDDMDIFKGFTGKDGSTYDLKFHFDRIRYFFPNNKFEGNHDKSFLEILNNIFTYKKISYTFLLGKIIEKIRELFSREEYIDNAVLSALMTIIFINNLNIFNDKPKGVLKIMAEQDGSFQKYLNFMDEYKDVFDSDFKRAVFLLGILVDRLLSIQYLERNSKPFYSRLNGLKLNEKLVRRIFTETLNKLNEYEKNHYYAGLEELISLYMLSGCELSDNDISFYFALGMTLGKRFFKNLNKNKEVDSND
ncbi:MAG: TIGR02556 family CRISPR-associated protein [Acetivibrionales bacterium]|jgi:CRISPR-associated protein Csh1